MPYSIPLGIALALSAAGLHAVWNVLLKQSEDPLRISTRALESAALISSPLVGITWLLSGRPGFPANVWLLAILSSVFELAYFVFLSRAYRLGDISEVYPVARGTAPLLLVASGLFLLREHLSGLALVGVLCLLAGIFIVRPPIRAGKALAPALLTGLTIASYSTIDRVGVRIVAPWLYGWAVWVMTASLLAIWLRAQRKLRERHRETNREVRPGLMRSKTDPSDVEPGWPKSILVGMFMTVSYLLVLMALSVAPLAIVAPVRESAIVLVTVWGLWRLQERTAIWPRVGGAVAIVAGIALLALG
jgi:drug/metabolite transporter (DMT)-like permease